MAIAALIILILVSAFFSGSESALFSLSRSQVRAIAARNPAGRELERLLERPRRILVTILLANLFVNIFATSAATAMMLELFGEAGLVYAFLGMSALIMAFGEILPKAIAMNSAERVALLVIIPLRVLHTILWPLRWPLSWFSDWVINYLRRHIGQVKRSFTWEELTTALHIGRREGGLGVFEYELLTNVLAFRQKIVKEIMTPSIRVESVSVRASRDEFMRVFSATGYSRVPVYDGSPDDIIGILHIKDLIDRSSAQTASDLRAKLRRPFFIQENAPIDELYNELQRRKLHIAVVLDEYGSMAGIVTTEDILEELVGDIRDARDPRTQAAHRIDDKRIVILGSTEIDEFNTMFDAELVDEDHETVAGFLTGLTGRIPREGETITWEGLRFHIVSAQPNRIRKIRVERE